MINIESQFKKFASEETSDTVLFANSIEKSYGTNCVLRGVNLRLRRGRVHALLGQNGAGKSTLIKILLGAESYESGEILFEGRRRTFCSVNDAISNGIVAVHQHLSVFLELSVIENLSAFAFGSGQTLFRRHATMARHEATTWLKAVGLEIDLDLRLGTVSVGERQLVEIARALSQRLKILILDEPTSALTSHEAEKLFASIRLLTQSGVSVVFISHRLDEIESIADDVTVLRDGKTVIDCAVSSVLGRRGIVEAMAGHEKESWMEEVPELGEVVIQVQQLHWLGNQPPVDIVVRSGEILGLAGLVGSGMTELAEVLSGAKRRIGGSIKIGGQPIPRYNRLKATALGIGFVPSDRQIEGLFGQLSARVNIFATTFRHFANAGVIRLKQERVAADAWMAKLNVHPNDCDQDGAVFSGGNQQKLIIARNLVIPNLKALVLIEPTQGVDIAARHVIHQQILEAARSGVAVILASSDLDEIRNLSSRLLVVRRGYPTTAVERGTAIHLLTASMASVAA